ncbi:Leucine Rich Repeat [Seminavis robusta]|uniref:Leucine Rich Repeat n=1 Tax=Seminavis robusta TaxID=568900 RepID=A0A9N8DBV1_9STRA|nr:Leucine Rich Repeat [Seminavis robusta]|eukprot:Sro50_g029140.1 Leucine Rich Repeat (852) ;mRNA; f:89971-92526
MSLGGREVPQQVNPDEQTFVSGLTITQDLHVFGPSLYPSLDREGGPQEQGTQNQDHVTNKPVTSTSSGHERERPTELQVGAPQVDGDHRTYGPNAEKKMKDEKQKIAGVSVGVGLPTRLDVSKQGMGVDSMPAKQVAKITAADVASEHHILAMACSSTTKRTSMISPRKLGIEEIKISGMDSKPAAKTKATVQGLVAESLEGMENTLQVKGFLHRERSLAMRGVVEQGGAANVELLQNTSHSVETKDGKVGFGVTATDTMEATAVNSNGQVIARFDPAGTPGAYAVQKNPSTQADTVENCKRKRTVVHERNATERVGQAESPLKRAMNVAESTHVFNPLDGLMPIPRTAATKLEQANTVRPGAYSATPGIELQRAATLNRSLVGAPSSSDFTVGSGDDDDHDHELPFPSSSITRGTIDDYATSCHVDMDALEVHQAPDPDLHVEEAEIVPESTDVDLHEQTPGLQEEAIMGKIMTEPQTPNHNIPYLVLLIGVVLGAAVVLLVVVLLGNGNNQATQESGMVQDVPMNATAHGIDTLEPIILPPFQEGLPQRVLDSLQDPNTPFYRANRWVIRDPYVDTYPPMRQTQRFYMAMYYYAMAGEYWLNNEGWLDYGVPECDWWTQKDPKYNEFDNLSACDEDGNLVKFNLAGNNLTGLFPVVNKFISTIRTFNMEDNFFSGDVPASAEMPELDVFIMANNKLDGRLLVDGGFVTFKQRIIKTNGNQLFGQAGPIFQYLPLLEHLDSTSNRFDGPILGLAHAANLKQLRNGDNLFTGAIPSEIGLLHEKLEEVDFGGNPMSGGLPSELGLLTKLTKLNISHTSFSGKIPQGLCELVLVGQLELIANCSQVECCSFR